MADAPQSDAPPPAEDAKISAEWRRLEQERLDEEIAEAREDVGTGVPARRGPGWLVWVALAMALVAGIAATVVINGGLGILP